MQPIVSNLFQVFKKEYISPSHCCQRHPKGPAFFELSNKQQDVIESRESLYQGRKTPKFPKPRYLLTVGLTGKHHTSAKDEPWRDIPRPGKINAIQFFTLSSPPFPPLSFPSISPSSLSHPLLSLTLSTRCRNIASDSCHRDAVILIKVSYCLRRAFIPHLDAGRHDLIFDLLRDDALYERSPLCSVCVRPGCWFTDNKCLWCI